MTLPVGRQLRSFLSVLAGATIDARATPGEGAKLTFIAVFGGAEIRVPRGARVSLDGFSLLGGRKIETSPGDGREITVRAFSFLGGLKITDRE